MGWLIEGALIPLVYDAPPISFVWPSLGWHMTITFGVAVGRTALGDAERGMGLAACDILGRRVRLGRLGTPVLRGGRGDDAPGSGGFLRAGGRRRGSF